MLNTGGRGFAIDCSGTRKPGDDSKGGLEFIDEDLGLRSVLYPPTFLWSDMLLGGRGESDLAGLQFERSSLQDLFRIDQPTVSRIGIRLTQGLVQSRAVSIVEPISRIKWQKLDFGALGQVRRFVDDYPTCVNAGFDGHSKTA